MEEEHPERVVGRPPNSWEMDQSIDTGSKGTVEPPSPLRDEFGRAFWDIGLGLTCFHVGKFPLGPCLGYKLKAQNSIFSQEHVFAEDAHPIDSLGSQTFCKGVISPKVLLEGPPLDSSKSIGREGTRQHRDVSERTFEWFVEDVRHFVFKILSGHKRIKKVFALGQHSCDLSAGTSKVWIVEKCLPQMIDRSLPRFRTSIEKHANLRL